jgi:hypothetical protein
MKRIRSGPIWTRLPRREGPSTAALFKRHRLSSNATVPSSRRYKGGLGKYSRTSRDQLKEACRLSEHHDRTEWMSTQRTRCYNIDKHVGLVDMAN